ncbi:MAG: O-antigen ligase family protein [Bryobacterales bacterium]|nr:O-antigen ligase family protein [Bryobacterales bacterium]
MPVHAATIRASAPVAVSSNRAVVWLAVLLAFSVPWGDMLLVGDSPFTRWLAPLVGLVWMMAAWRIPPRKPHPALLIMVVFALWVLLSAFTTMDFDRTYRRVLSYLQLFLVALVIFQCTRNRRDWLRALQGFGLGLWPPVLGVAYNLQQGVFQGDGRYTAPGFDPNDLAASLSLGIPVAWYLLMSTRRLRWLNGLYVPCASIAILLTASRGGMVTLAIAMLFPLWSITRVSWTARMGGVLLLAASSLAVITFREEISVHRLATIWSQLMARDLNGRFDVWMRGAQLFLESPLLGVGPGAFARAISSDGGSMITAHNAFLEVVVEHGAVGLVLFSGIVVALALSLRRQESLDRRLLTTLLVIWFTACQALSWENREITWALWALCAACPPLLKHSRARVFNGRLPLRSPSRRSQARGCDPFPHMSSPSPGCTGAS